MDMNALRNDKEALLRYVRNGQVFEGQKVITYKLLPLRIWEGRRFLVSLKVVLTGDLPKLRVYDVTNLDIAEFPDPHLAGRKVGVLSASSGWDHPKVLLENGIGHIITSTLICSEVEKGKS